MRTCIHIVFRPGIGTVLKFALFHLFTRFKNYNCPVSTWPTKSVFKHETWLLIMLTGVIQIWVYGFELMRFVQGNAAIFQDLYGTANRTHDIFNRLSSYCNPLSWIRNINHRKFIEHESWAIPKKLEQNSVS
jgi:hypothetical protein